MPSDGPAAMATTVWPARAAGTSVSPSVLLPHAVTFPSEVNARLKSQPAAIAVTVLPVSASGIAVAPPGV